MSASDVELLHSPTRHAQVSVVNADHVCTDDCYDDHDEVDGTTIRVHSVPACGYCLDYQEVAGGVGVGLPYPCPTLVALRSGWDDTEVEASRWRDVERRADRELGIGPWRNLRDAVEAERRGEA